MDTPEEIRRRYQETVTKNDARGRAIVVGRLKMSQETRAAEFAESFASVEMMRTVASVRSIDDDQFAFPRDRATVDSVMDRLDREGLQAAREGLSELVGPPKDLQQKVEEAKN